MAGKNYNNNNNRNYNSNYDSTNKEKKKHSGCTSGQDKNGKQYLRGWKYDKRNGMRSFYASPYKGTKRTTSEAGIDWENWMVKVTLSDGQEYIRSGLYNVRDRKLTIPDLGYVMNPKGGKGGYTGTFSNN